MKFVPDNHSGLRIHGYGTGLLKLALPSGIVTELPYDHETGLHQVTQSIILSGQGLICNWPPATLAQLTMEHIDIISSLEPELVLLGTGARLQFPVSEILAPLHQRGIGLEIMDTAAACRTFNILMSEGRKVAAALLIN
ncbi:MAG: Mth938-like domain-containing protein [Gammaproteobacteria bacterium]|nr:Mth938-like domain-containing protein [Gammaproteobacteria bacterium]